MVTELMRAYRIQQLRINTSTLYPCKYYSTTFHLNFIEIHMEMDEEKIEVTRLHRSSSISNTEMYLNTL